MAKFEVRISQTRKGIIDTKDFPQAFIADLLEVTEGGDRDAIVNSGWTASDFLKDEEWTLNEVYVEPA